MTEDELIKYYTDRKNKLYNDKNIFFVVKDVKEKYARTASGLYYIAICSLWWFQPAPWIKTIVYNENYEFYLLENRGYLYNPDTEVTLDLLEVENRLFDNYLKDGIKMLFEADKKGAEISLW